MYTSSAFSLAYVLLPTYIHIHIHIHIHTFKHLYQIIVRRVRPTTPITQDSTSMQAIHPWAYHRRPRSHQQQSHSLTASQASAGLAERQGGKGVQGAMLSKSFFYPEQAKQKKPMLSTHGRAYRDPSCSSCSMLIAHAPSSSSAILLPCALVSLSIKSDTPKLLPYLL